MVGGVFHEEKPIPGSLCSHIKRSASTNPTYGTASPWVDVIAIRDDVSIGRVTFSSR